MPLPPRTRCVSVYNTPTRFTVTFNIQNLSPMNILTTPTRGVALTVLALSLLTPGCNTLRQVEPLTRLEPSFVLLPPQKISLVDTVPLGGALEGLAGIAFMNSDRQFITAAQGTASVQGESGPKPRNGSVNNSNSTLDTKIGDGELLYATIVLNELYRAPSPAKAFSPPVLTDTDLPTITEKEDAKKNEEENKNQAFLAATNAYRLAALHAHAQTAKLGQAAIATREAQLKLSAGVTAMPATVSTATQAQPVTTALTELKTSIATLKIMLAAYSAASDLALSQAENVSAKFISIEAATRDSATYAQTKSRTAVALANETAAQPLRTEAETKLVTVELKTTPLLAELNKLTSDPTESNKATLAQLPEKLSALNTELSSALAAISLAQSTYNSQVSTLQERRDALAGALILVSNHNTSVFLNRVFNNKAFADTSRNLFRDLFVGAGAITAEATPGVSAGLSIVSLVLDKTIENIDKQYFAASSFQAVEAAIQARRVYILSTIRDGLRKPYADYPTDQLISDVQTLDEACSLKAGIRELQRKAEAKVTAP
jgi:hypothetical protein